MAAKAVVQKKTVNNGSWGFFFVTTYVGAAVYFVQHSAGFWGFILALLKATVWPAYVLHACLKLLSI
jgi:hypothetical protein